jgi:hypothetical protein
MSHGVYIASWCRVPSTQFKATPGTIQRLPLARVAAHFGSSFGCARQMKLSAKVAGNRPRVGVFMRNVQNKNVAAPQTFHRIVKL